MKKTIALIALAIGVLPMATHAATPKPKAKSTTYECQKCHMQYSAAAAKKDHYKDPMDGGKLVPVSLTKKAPAAASKASMSHMKM
ncbi:hypothetical protein CCAX7_30960 [Capsulimonas corticalis]|uniref:Uncharacterized protein n=1 Tax=Capsulimonas corticalis TaxID=2219043 RepID=A0A402CSL9_9BACT|nr:hypothetical protein [Capsulimonas corticalis]BDI31045.1 hypothetical protein CCAX7_30960 [Capsulimonas corticalis]